MNTNRLSLHLIIFVLLFVGSSFYVGKYIKQQNIIMNASADTVGYDVLIRFQKNYLMLEKLKSNSGDVFSLYQTGVFVDKLNVLEIYINNASHHEEKKRICNDILGYKKYFESKKKLHVNQKYLVSYMDAILKNCNF